MNQTASIGAVIVPVTPLQQNCTIVWCAKTMKAAIIDPGAEADRLIAVVKSRGLTLERIWVTHGHLDHCGGADELRDRTGVAIEGPHLADAFWLQTLDDMGAAWGMPQARSFTPDRWLVEGDRVQVGEAEFEIYETPGHTPGHVIFFQREARFAQVGDVLFKGSIGRTDFPGSDHQALLDSVAHKLWPLGDDVQFVPGHGPSSTFAAERRTNPFVADRVLAAAQQT